MASEKPVVTVTCTAPVNIAVIKYCECMGRECGRGGDSPARVGWTYLRPAAGRLGSPPLVMTQLEVQVQL